MNIAVVSGKGGTGKTTISTNLVLLLKANYIDCDVEEPNGFIFLKATNIQTEDVRVENPLIDQEKCTLCGDCVIVCQFNALAKAKDRIISFEKLCHSCGACGLVCSQDAIEYGKRSIGRIEGSDEGEILLKRGILNIGEPIALPVLRKLLKGLPENDVNLLDSPPGTSCNVVNLLKEADGAILVTEPTVFGLHDLKMTVELVRQLRLPFGLIINKQYGQWESLDKYIREEELVLLGTIPYKREIAELYSKGDTLLEIEESRQAFMDIAEGVREVLLCD